MAPSYATHVSQPSLSQQIQKLEDELGERLFDRMKRAAKLTPHGETFLPHAVRILHEVEAAKREAVDAQMLLCGTVTIGVLSTIAPATSGHGLAGAAKISNYRNRRNFLSATF